VVSREVEPCVPPLKSSNGGFPQSAENNSLDWNCRHFASSHTKLYCIKAVNLTGPIILYDISSNYGTKEQIFMVFRRWPQGDLCV
jgi:hypothetical protein